MSSWHCQFFWEEKEQDKCRGYLKYAAVVNYGGYRMLVMYCSKCKAIYTNNIVRPKGEEE